MPASLNSILPPAASITMSAEESKVISVPSFVIVSRAILPTFVISKSPKLVVPPTVKLPVTVKLSATVVSLVVCPIVNAIPDVSVAIFKAPVLFAIYELVPS